MKYDAESKIKNKQMIRDRLWRDEQQDEESLFKDEKLKPVLNK